MSSPDWSLLVRRAVALAIVVWVSGLMPFTSALLDEGAGVWLVGEYEDPCAGCPEDTEDDGAPCSPACTDCLCVPNARAPLPQGFAGRLPPPVGDPVLVTAATTYWQPSQAPQLDGLLRPPRA